MRKRTFFFLFSCFASIYILASCYKGVSNNPESVATAVIESLMSGDYELLKKYATDDVSRMIDTTNVKSVFKRAEILKNMHIEGCNVSEQSYDGTVKDVNFNMVGHDKVMKVKITMVDVNGKWLYDNIQYK